LRLLNNDLLFLCSQILGALLLPHFNSKAIVILVIDEGEASIEFVGIREQQQEEEIREVRKYRAELSEDDIFVIPAAYPFVVNATSNLNFLAFGVNAENNQRNFLAGTIHMILNTLLLLFSCETLANWVIYFQFFGAWLKIWRW